MTSLKAFKVESTSVEAFGFQSTPRMLVAVAGELAARARKRQGAAELLVDETASTARH